MSHRGNGQKSNNNPLKNTIMKLSKLYLLTIGELEIIADNMNTFGSMLARVELNRRNTESGLELRYELSRIDKEQYKRELYSVEWI
jgi:hypothetical protein